MSDETDTAIAAEISETEQAAQAQPGDTQIEAAADTEAAKDPKATNKLKNVGEVVYDLLSKGRDPVEREAAEKKKAKAAKAPPEEKKEPEATADTKTPEPEKKEPRKRTRPREVDPVEIASRAAAETADRLSERWGKPKPGKAEPFEIAAPDDTKDLKPEQKRHIAVLREMETLYPEKYEGIAKRSLQSLSAIEEYTQKWKRENPGHKFDAEATEHVAFFEVIEPDFDDVDYYDAVAAIRVKPMEKLAKEHEATKEELKTLRDEREAQAIAPEIQSSRIAAATDVITELDPKILEAKTEKDLVAMAEADPDRTGTAIMFAGQAAAVMGVAAAILDGKGKITIDEKAPEVEGFFALKTKFERELKSLPIQDQYDDEGRRFATWDEFARIAVQDPEEARKYWILKKPQLRRLIAAEFTDLARKEIKKKEDQFERTAKARGFSPSNATAKETKPVPPTNGKPVVKQEATPPPAAAGRTPVGTTANQEKAKTTDWRDNLLSAFGR